MIRDRDNALKACLELRDKNWLNNLAHCREIFRLMTYEQVNNRTLLESLAKRQQELTKSNAKKTVSSKKKVPLPQIRISDRVPYTIVLQGVENPPIPFSNLNPKEEMPSEPCKALVQNKTPSAIGKKELTPVEEVEEYLRMESTKEMASKRKKMNIVSSHIPSVYHITHT